MESDLELNSNDDMSTTASSDQTTSLLDVFEKNFETLKDIYNRVTGATLKRPDEFMIESTMNIRGEETVVRSSVDYENVMMSDEGEWRGAYFVTSNFIRYFLFMNMGSNPSDFNAFSLRVGRPARDLTASWAEIRMSTMPAEMAMRVFPKAGGGENMDRKKRGKKMFPRKRRDEDEDVVLTQDEGKDERFEGEEVSTEVEEDLSSGDD